MADTTTTETKAPVKEKIEKVEKLEKAVKTDSKADAKAAAVTEGKAKALGLALETIEKQFGKGSIMKLGERTDVDVECIPTGSLGLDLALGGGLPKGRVIEV